MGYGQPVGFILANLDSQSVPTILEAPVADGETFFNGALLVLNAGELEECGADPDVVDGVALARYGNPDDPSFDILGNQGMPPGYMQYAQINTTQVFSARWVGTLGTVGTSYGVALNADGVWEVDFADTTNLVVKLVSREWADSPVGKNRVLVTFLQEALEVAP